MKTSIVFLVGLALCACGSGTDPLQTQDPVFTSALAKWSGAGIHDYNIYEVMSSVWIKDSALVEVRGDTILKVTFYPASQNSGRPPTVTELFRNIQDARASGATVTATYDAGWGFPSNVSFDTHVPDTGYSITVRNIQISGVLASRQ
jgi:hypothetical protein